VHPAWLPYSLLDVRGTLTVQNPPNVASNDIVIKRPGALSASSVEFVLNERENNTTLFIYGYNGSTYKNFVEFDYLDFKTMFPGNGSTLVIDEANNLVGVGTATPGQMLDVVGNIRTNSALITPVLRPVTDATNALRIQTANGLTDILNVDTTNKRIGIMTDSPAQALDVVGQIRANNGSNAPLNVQVLSANPVSPATGDIWLVLSGTNCYLRAYMNGAVKSVTLT